MTCLARMGAPRRLATLMVRECRLTFDERTSARGGQFKSHVRVFSPAAPISSPKLGGLSIWCFCCWRKEPVRFEKQKNALQTGEVPYLS